MKTLQGALATASALAAAALAAAVGDAATAQVAVTGLVLDEFTGEPVVGAAVRVTAGDDALAFATDSAGRFTMEGMAVGSYFIELSRDGYEPLEGDLRIDRPGEFFLAMAPLYLDRGNLTGIVGVVTDMATGLPISDAAVSVAGLGHAATSDAGGRFDMLEMAPGDYEVVFAHLGYRQRSETVRVEQGRVSLLADVALAVDAIPLDPIDVTVERRDATLQRVGFYEREEDGWGDFISREDLESWSAAELSDAMLRLPGVTVVHDPSAMFRRLVGIRKHGSTCFPSVYLDDVLVHLGGRGEAAGINDLVDPIAVAGVELYRRTAGMPPQYWGMSSDCGVVLIWTRRS